MRPLFPSACAALALAGAGAMLAAPPFTVTVQAQDYAFISSNLFAENVREGKDGAAGDFSAEADFVEGTLCYYLEIFGYDEAQAIAIYRGAEDEETGAKLIDLRLPEDSSEEVCVTADGALLREIADAPGAYYVAVTDPVHPNGGMRGQFE